MYHGERFNSISHLAGTVASFAGLVGLLYLAIKQGDPWKIVSFTLYGSTLVLLYLSSTLYHCTPKGPKKKILQKLDHLAIYLLIAGSYTPFTLVTLELNWGLPLFFTVWGLAILGIIIDIFSRQKERLTPIAIYLIMGWLILIAINPLFEALPSGALAWLVAGGALYSAGLVFYIKDESIKHGHGIWHMFVLAGSVSHYIVVAGYVA